MPQARERQEPALSRWLSTNKRGTPITPVVLLTHPGARVGSMREPTVRVERSVRRLLALVERSGYALDAGRRTDIERLIRRDHEFHKAKKPLSEQHGVGGPLWRRRGTTAGRPPCGPPEMPYAPQVAVDDIGAEESY